MASVFFLELFRILILTSPNTGHAHWSRPLIRYEIVSCPLICHNLIFILITMNKSLFKMLIHNNSTSSWKQVATKLYLFDCWTNYLSNGSEKITLLTPSKKNYQQHCWFSWNYSKPSNRIFPAFFPNIKGVSKHTYGIEIDFLLYGPKVYEYFQDQSLIIKWIMETRFYNKVCTANGKRNQVMCD